MTSWLIGTGIELVRTLVISALVLAPFMAYPRTRRVIIVTLKFTARHSPKWARPVIIGAQFFPGQLDDIAIFAILIIPILRRDINRRTFARAVRMAWRGTL